MSQKASEQRFLHEFSLEFLYLKLRTVAEGVRGVRGQPVLATSLPFCLSVCPSVSFAVLGRVH